MALLPDDDKQKKDDAAAGQGTSGGSGSILGTSGENATAGGGGAPTAGTGGQTLGGFTNIQDYLTANSGNTGSAQALKNQVGGAFDTEKQNVTQGADQAKQQAQGQVDKNNIGQDQASKMISESSKMYGQGNDQYDQNKQKIQGALNAQYDTTAAPTSYNYGLNANTQKYGQDLGDDQGYQTLMKNIYQQSSQGADSRGAALGSGGMALQQQIDSGNSALGDTRKQLLDQYSGLTPYVDDQVAGANTAIGNAQTAVQTNRNSLQDYLTGQRSTLDSDITGKVSGVNGAVSSAFDKALTPQDPNVDYRLHPELMTGGWAKYGTDSVLGQQHPIATVGNLAGLSGDRDTFNTLSDYLSNPTRYTTDPDSYDLSKVGYTGHDAIGAARGLDGDSSTYGDRFHQISNFMTDDQKRQMLALGLVPSTDVATPVDRHVAGAIDARPIATATPTAPAPVAASLPSAINQIADGGQTILTPTGVRKNVVRF